MSRTYKKGYVFFTVCVFSLSVSAQVFAECGNSILDSGEACDDGNIAGGDGCSASCQVENGWNCTLPENADTTNLLADPGFEAGQGGGLWTESSVAFGSPICNSDICGQSSQRSGTHWVWFGGVIIDPEEAMVSQQLVIPDTAYELSFWLHAEFCDSASDYVEVLIDDTSIWELHGDDISCGEPSYSQVVLDITAFADNAVHEVAFHSETFSDNEDSSDFHLDDTALPRGPFQPVPSQCEMVSVEEIIFKNGFES
jgi:cysteine-rich repeat protein